MFKIKQTNTFLWTVRVSVPTSGGRHEIHTFDLEFRRLTQSELTTLAENIQNEQQTALEIVRDIVVGWPSGAIVDDDGPVPYSDSALQQLLEVPMVAGAILTAFLDAYNGQAAKRKN
jgi:hypothetical protein